MNKLDVIARLDRAMQHCRDIGKTGLQSEQYTKGRQFSYGYSSLAELFLFLPI
jgi:hypothetical protein